MYKKYIHYSDQQGFTLIELMISLSIIIIVMAIAVPNFQSASEKAQISGCEGNQKILVGHMENYFIVEKQYPLTTIDKIKNFYGEDFSLDQKRAGYESETGEDAMLHTAYHLLDKTGDGSENEKDKWKPIDMSALKSKGYFREIVSCPSGGVYLVKLENGKISEIMCSVHGNLLD